MEARDIKKKKRRFIKKHSLNTISLLTYWNILIPINNLKIKNFKFFSKNMTISKIVILVLMVLRKIHSKILIENYRNISKLKTI